jgi:hypothetical protein
MIGTTLKVGFDATKVNRGLGGLRGKLGRVGRQIGIGMARNVGARATDMLGRVLMAVPDAISETTDWMSNMTDMATQTGMTVKELIILEEKLRLSGAGMRDSSKMISTMTDALHEARNEIGPARDALNQLNFTADEFKDKTPAEAFDMLGKRAALLGSDFDGLETAMADLFGAKMGFGLLRFFNDLEANSKKAVSNVGQFAEQSEKSAVKMDALADTLGRWETIKRSFSSIVLDEFFRFGGDDAGDKLFDFLNPEKLRPQIQEIGKEIKAMFDRISSGESTILGEIAKIGRAIGKAIGDGIKESFGFGGDSWFSKLLGSNDIIPDIDGKGLRNKNTPFNKVASTKTMEKLLNDATNILEKIHTKQGIAIAI